MLELCRDGAVSAADAYGQWNMGNGMLLVVAADDETRVLDSLSGAGYRVRSAGRIVRSPQIVLDATAWGFGELTVSTGDPQ